MRVLLGSVAVLLLVFANSQAGAVDLEKCSQPSVPDKISCLNRNVVLLNSSYETVARELRTAVVALQAVDEALTKRD